MRHEELLSTVTSAAERILERTVRPTDDFFDIGGDSVSAVELMNELEHGFRVHLALSDIFDAKSMDDIATMLESRLGLRPRG